MIFDGISLTEGSQITNVTIASGSTLPTSPTVGEVFFLTGTGLKVYDGTSWISVGAPETGGSGATGGNSDISVSVTGLSPLDMTLVRIYVATPFSIAANLTGSGGSALTASTAGQDWQLLKNDIQFGTITWPAATEVEPNPAPVAVSSATSFVIGDYFSIYTPSTQLTDTLSDVSYTIKIS